MINLSQSSRVGPHNKGSDALIADDPVDVAPVSTAVRIAPGDDLSIDLRGADLRGRDLSGADLDGRDLSGADLREAILFGARMTGAILIGADLRGADLREATAEKANFGHADLRSSVFFGACLDAASFIAANLGECDLRGVTLHGATLRAADLGGANLARADARDACFENTNLSSACLEGVSFAGARFSHARNFESASWIDADLVGADFRGAHALHRFALDQNYLHEFRNRSRSNAAVYVAWKLTSDCGRSLLRWSVFIGIVATAFAVSYAYVPIDYGDHETWLSPFYFSVVTLTTLGFGDALPTNVLAQIVVIAEVLIGYMCLGGMVAILSNKLARRAR